jgi:hypothetical protein
LQFDAQAFTLTPESGPPLAFDLGDLDAVTAADWEVRLPLYTGRTILLRQLGRGFDNLAHDLLEAFRQRTIQCLLLEDMQEIARFPGSFELSSTGSSPRSSQAEFRLCKSNLAVLPAASQAFQWRLADIDSVQFDSSNYLVVIKSGPETLTVSRLAKRTEEFATKLRDAMSDISTASAQALHASFPFLNPDQLQSMAALLKEGRSAPVAELAAIHPKMPAALAANAVDKDLKPYYDQLLTRTANGMLYAGFKLVRPEDGSCGMSDGSDQTAAGSRSDTGSQGADAATASSDDDDNAPDADNKGPQTLYWFFFPIAAKAGSSEPTNVVAWEASSRSGRATYFFRLVDPAKAAQLQDASNAPTIVGSSVRRLNRVLAMLNFRRRPIYLSDDELDADPRFRRYAIAARRMPEVREMRASFLGRAFHSSLEAWRGQVAAILVKAGV